MRKSFVVLLCIALAFSFVGCSTVADLVTGGVAKSVSDSGSKAVKAPMDIKGDEVLCSEEGAGNMLEADYYVARIMTKASAETKNQAEVLRVHDGKKMWSEFVVPSHKAQKNELSVGQIVLFPHGWQGYKEMDADDYRFASWGMGRVTSLDELFKDLVEVNGDKYGWAIIRIPDTPVKE